MKISEEIQYYLEMYNYYKSNFSTNATLQPAHIYIEPTNSCNLACPFCDTSSLERTKQSIDKKSFKKVIDEIVDNSWHASTRITLTGQGEPLINKNIPEMISYAKSVGIKHVEIITNATLMTEDIAKKILNAKIDRVQFSIDSLNKEHYDILRASKKKNHSYFDVVLKNILIFLKLNEKMGHNTYVSISAVQTNLNKIEEVSFKEFWNQLPIDNVYLAPMSSLQDNNPMDEAQRFKGNIETKQICIIPWITMSIKADGDIVLCSHDYHNRYPVGNIKKDKLIDVWNNSKACKLREALINGKLEYFVSILHDCEKCNNPCQGSGLTDYTQNISLYMEKTILGKFYTKKSVNLNFLEKTLKEIDGSTQWIN